MMGKRPRQLVILSSSDEEDCISNVHSSKIAVCDSKTGSYGEQKKLKDDKGYSGLGIQLQKANLSRTEDWSAFLPETFSEAPPLQQQSAMPKNRNQRSRTAQIAEKGLWVDKYKPKTLTELAANKKKVAEVKAWIEGKLNGSLQNTGSHVLLLKGPTGVGKTTTIHLLIDLLGIEFYEWDTPTPTLWREYIHHINSGTSYISKLDEFEAFLDAIRKYPILNIGSSNATGRLRKDMLLLVDDLPTPNSWEACQQLCQGLRHLALSAQFPTIVSITEFTESGDREGPGRMIQELELALEQGGATKIVFNPLTSKSITKTLTKIWTAEHRSLPPEWLSYISESSGGDLRHAINSLQFYCLSKLSDTWDQGSFEYPGLPKPQPNKHKRKKVAQSSILAFSFPALTNNVKSSMGRDGILSLFHALGKVLHNKRHTDEIADSGQGTIVLEEKFVRYPSKMGVPEIVLSQAHTEPGTFSAFLHENVLDFINDEAIDDAWMAVSYLSDSDYLLGASSIRHLRRPQTLLDLDEVDSAHVVESIAGSVMTRGVLFANSHPAPPRWQSIRGPILWQVERSFREKKIEIFSERWVSGSLSGTCGLSILATEYKPFKHLLAQPVLQVQLKSIRDCKQGEDFHFEEEIAAEIDSLELDDLFSDCHALSKSNNIGHAYINSNINEIPGEMDEDEIEEW